ncbi:PQQ-binding-like beta-propeller repeat protein [Spirillospora sp. CA-108201]
MWGGEDATYGVDAASGRRLWTADVSMFAGGAVHGSTFVLPNGAGLDGKTTITLVDAASGEPTHLPMPGGRASRFRLRRGRRRDPAGVGDVLGRGHPAVWAVDLAGGKARWRFPLADSAVEGAVGRSGLYLNAKHTLSAVDLATGRRRWAVDWSRSGQDWPTRGVAVAGGRVFGRQSDLQGGRPAHPRPCDRGPGWTLAGPERFVGQPGRDAASDDVLAVPFSSGSACGVFAATTSGRGLWALWSDVARAKEWGVVVSGSSIFATDHQRLLCFRTAS